MDFDELLENYEKPIYNLILRLVGNAEEAADLTQDVFVSAYKGSASYRRDCAEYTWLYSIAINHCKNKYRQRDRKKTKDTLSLDDDTRSFDNAQPLAPGAVPETPLESLHRKELRQQIEAAIIRLPYDQRVVVVLRDMHGLSYQEIADIIGVNADIVRTRLARARAALRRYLEPYLKP